MRLLLPPSEAKTVGGRGRPLARRPAPTVLAEPRERVRAALAELVDGPADRAAAALLLPPGVAPAALAANAAVASSPTRPALERYSGVVYDGMAYAELSPAARRWAGRSVLIFSGLFGVVRGDEPVPAYRVPAKATLPGLGGLVPFWRGELAPVVPDLLGRGVVLDLRSSDYAALWRPPHDLAARVITVRVLSRTPAGGRGVISYPSKLAKGRLAAAVLERAAAGSVPQRVEDVAAAWAAATGAAWAITGPGRLELYPGEPHRL